LHSLHKTRTKLCKKCGIETIFVPFDLGLQIVKADIVAKVNLLSNGNLHLSDSHETANLVCLQSLQSEFRQEKKGERSSAVIKTKKLFGKFPNDIK
jgi:hypothetical protein